MPASVLSSTHITSDGVFHSTAWLEPNGFLIEQTATSIRIGETHAANIIATTLGNHEGHIILHHVTIRRGLPVEIIKAFCYQRAV